MTTEDYLKASYEHVKEDEEVTEKGLRSVQRNLNAACSLFIKIFKVGESADQVDRHRANVINHSVNPSAMKILHKDHKKGGKVQVRRLNGPGMNIHLSNFLAEILEPIGGEMEGRAEKGSTENVLYEVDRYNEEIEKSEMVACARK